MLLSAIMFGAAFVGAEPCPTYPLPLAAGTTATALPSATTCWYPAYSATLSATVHPLAVISRPSIEPHDQVMSYQVSTRLRDSEGYPVMLSVLTVYANGAVKCSRITNHEMKVADESQPGFHGLYFALCGHRKKVRG